MKRLVTMLGLLLLVAACSQARAAGTDAEQVMALALQKAIGEKAVPDYALAAQKGHLVLRDSAAVASEPVTMIPVPDSAVPRLNGLKIDRLPMPKIRDKAERDGPFVYVSVWKLDIQGSEAFVTVSTSWIVPKKKKQNFMPMSGGSMRMRMVRREGSWEFDKVVEWVIS
jgi:hypothetical protein